MKDYSIIDGCVTFKQDSSFYEVMSGDTVYECATREDALNTFTECLMDRERPRLRKIINYEIIKPSEAVPNLENILIRLYKIRAALQNLSEDNKEFEGNKKAMDACKKSEKLIEWIFNGGEF